VTGRPATILVAEDSLVVRAVVRRHLEAQGYDVLEAEDGPAALQRCRAEQPDVVLLDVEMPGLTGYQVLEALKADSELSLIPVVFLTGRTSTEDVVAGLALGAHDYLKKPFEPAELIARVSSAVRLKAVQDELRARNAELDRLSRTDTLTGVHNRRHVEEHLDQHASAARRHGQELSAIMLDIDHFKAINDAFGHAAGDAVLQEFARRLGTILRAEDIGARWGGEEFLVILPYTDLEGAAVLGERFRASVADEPFVVPPGQTISVTVSGGCASGGGEDPEQLVRDADAALYDAKQSGRNRVVVARRSGALPLS
jgi:diguanylate cyclase (GGDEF)-like protein